jgi:hypothetical protein
MTAHTLPSRLWIQCSIAGCDARRLWKTSAFSPVDFVEKGHGWLFPQPARAAATGLLLGGLLLLGSGCRPVVERSEVRAAPDAVAPMATPTVAEQIVAVQAGEATRLRVADRPLSEEEWQAVARLEALEELTLERGRADDTHAVLLAALPRLRRMVLRESALTDEGLRQLARCRTLETINLPQAACTVEGLRAIGKLPRLKSLRLGSSRLAGPEVGAALAGFPALRSLHLIDVPLGDRGLEALGTLPGLWNLYLDGAGVSDAAWEEYFRRQPDVHVHVDQTHHDRDPGRHQ